MGKEIAHYVAYASVAIALGCMSGLVYMSMTMHKCPKQLCNNPKTHIIDVDLVDHRGSSCPSNLADLEKETVKNGKMSGSKFFEIEQDQTSMSPSNQESLIKPLVKLMQDYIDANILSDSAPNRKIELKLKIIKLNDKEYLHLSAQETHVNSIDDFHG